MKFWVNVVVHVSKASIWEAETGGLSWVQGQPGVQHEILAQKTKQIYM